MSGTKAQSFFRRHRSKLVPIVFFGALAAGGLRYRDELKAWFADQAPPDASADDPPTGAGGHAGHGGGAAPPPSAAPP